MDIFVKYHLYLIQTCKFEIREIWTIIFLTFNGVSYAGNQ